MKLAFLILLCNICFGQAYKKEFFGAEVSPLLNSINSIELDREENLWIATDRGILKFDGINFIEYTIPNFDDKDLSIKKIIMFKNDLYILYKDQGLVSVNTQTESVTIISKESIHDFFVDEKMVLMYTKKLDIKIKKGNHVITYKTGIHPRHKLPNSSNYCISSYHNIIYFSVPTRGIFQLKNSRTKNIIQDKNVPLGYNEKFTLQNGKLYFIGLNYPLLITDNGTKLLDDDYDPSVLAVNDISYTRMNDLFYIKNNRSLVLKTSDSVQQIIKDSKGIELKKFLVSSNNIYIATNQGLYKLTKNNNFISAVSDNNLIVRRKIIVEPKRILLFGFPNILSHDKGKTEIISKVNTSIYDAVKVDNSYYLGTEGKGLMVADDCFKHIVRNTIIREDHIFSLSADKSTGLIYAGGYEFLYRFRPDSRTVLNKIPNPYSGYAIKVIVKDAVNERIIVGTDHGIFIVNEKTSKISKFFEGRIIGDIIIEKNKFLWVGHEHGLTVFDLNSLRKIKHFKLDFLENPKVATLVRDENGVVWAGTFSGIVAYDRKTNKFLALKNFKNLINKEFNYKSANKLNDGNLIFGGLNGYDIVNIHKVNFNSLEGSISGYHLIGSKDSIYKTFPRNSSISYYGKDYSARIYVTTKKKLSKDNCKFEYKINNSNWFDLTNGSYIDLISFLPNTYYIQVRGFDELGRSIIFKPVKVSVTQNFFETEWFLVLIIMSLAILVIVNFFLINNRLQLRNDIYEKINMDLHDEIGTILSKTSLLISYSKSIDRETILRNVKQANYGLKVYIDTSRQLRKKIVSLYYEGIEIMESSLKIRDIPFTHSFLGSKDVKINSNLYKDIKLCLYEVFNNTIKYSTTNFVSLEFIEKKGLLMIIITEKNNFFIESKLGNGIHNINKRVNRNNGRLMIDNNDQDQIYCIKMEFKI